MSGNFEYLDKEQLDERAKESKGNEQMEERECLRRANTIYWRRNSTEENKDTAKSMQQELK